MCMLQWICFITKWYITPSATSSIFTVSSFVKIPEIFIFTLERYLIRNKVPVEPDDNINIYKYADKNLYCTLEDCNYELFAINIRIGEDLSSGHEICQVKEKEKW